MYKNLILVFFIFCVVKAQAQSATIKISLSDDAEKDARIFSMQDSIQASIPKGSSQEFTFQMTKSRITKNLYVNGFPLELELAPKDMINIQLSGKQGRELNISGGSFEAINQFYFFKSSNMPTSWSKAQSTQEATAFEASQKSFLQELEQRANQLYAAKEVDQDWVNGQINMAKYYSYTRMLSYPFMYAAYSFKKKPDSLPTFTQAILTKEILNQAETAKYGQNFLGTLVYNVGRYYKENYKDSPNATSMAVLAFITERVSNPEVKSLLAQNLMASQLRNYAVDNIAPILEYFTENCLDEKARETTFAKVAEMTGLGPGAPAPEIELITMDGQKRYLSEFKGKNVYIDVWATYCGKCLAEMPSFRKLEEDYKDKNWVFLSVSLDTNVKKWKAKAQKLGHTELQFIVEKGHKSKFNEDYKIGYAPRYIIIDKDGKLINFNAPFPSEPMTRKILDKTL